MKIDEMRNGLLSDHADLRAKITGVRTTMALWIDHRASHAQVRSDLIALADAVRIHNAREEQALGPLIPTIDAWGPVRAEIMNEEHRKEHCDLYTALFNAASAVEPLAWRQFVDLLLARVLDHMAAEECGFLNEEVLRDDSVAVDQTGG